MEKQGWLSPGCECAGQLTGALDVVQVLELVAGSIGTDGEIHCGWQGEGGEPLERGPGWQLQGAVVVAMAEANKAKG